MNRCYTIFFFAALKPATNPTAWQYVSRIDHTPAMSARGASVEGPCNLRWSSSLALMGVFSASSGCKPLHLTGPHCLAIMAATGVSRFRLERGLCPQIFWR